MSKYEKQYELKGSFITPTADGVLLIRQATERGVIECFEGGVFDASYPSSPYRRSRVQSDIRCSGCLTAGESQVYLYESLKEIEL